ncbi:uncharacterized protein ZK1073.1-like [Watersipora subatra]|uniref:uncharacterized protein ZK1073.1-like n=1 Tax=Watersipora subatra TaxID=2589382 RepID=UPI00355C5166
MASSIVAFDTQKAGTLNCQVDGDLASASVVILTVHDLGCNSTSWNNFVKHPSMAEITKRVVYLHVNVPGHEEGASALPADFKFPSMDDLAASLDDVCAKVQCPIIGLGEGAGANILARWVLSAPKQLLGAVLIHCTSTTAGYLESMKDKNINWKLLGGMHPSAENYLVMHRFGDFSHAKDAEQVKGVIDDFHTQLNSTMNSVNIRNFINCFVNRSNIAEKMGSLTLPILIITGAKASHNHTVHTLYNAAIRAVSDRQKVEFLEVPDIANVVEGAPHKLAESLQYFMQGRGVLGGAPMPNVPSSIKSGTTMGQLDKSDL